MDDMERMMASLPCLKHLELIANCNNDVVNGERWQIKVKNLVTFKFAFNLLVQLQSKDLDSFHTQFWLEEKCWFVAYANKRLFSVPHFTVTETDENFCLPLYSTAPDNRIFYERIDKLQLTEIPNNEKDHFSHVQTLTLYRPIPLTSLEKIVNLSQVQHLILHSQLKIFPFMLLMDQIPNLRQISIEVDMMHFFKQVRSEPMEKIQTLQIRDFCVHPDAYTIEQLSSVFPNIEHLKVDHTCSTIQICDFLDRFKHLSTASFRYVSWPAGEKKMQQGRLNVQSVLDQIRRRQTLNYTYRFDCLSVHIWVG
jgi:hypothetical protein